MQTNIISRIYIVTLMALLAMIILSCNDDNENINENLPTIFTTEVISITSNTATSGGNITDDAGAAITARGVIWSTSSDLSLDNYEGITNEGAGAGSFTSNITGLEPETMYYVRAYATNSHGRGYGNALAFATFEETTGIGTVMDIEGNVYQTVIIGSQQWMAENLRVTKYNNEDDILTGLGDTEWFYTTNGAYAIYPHVGNSTDNDVEGINSDKEMIAAYGMLYNWYAVADEKGLCPEGWSVPSDDDWKQLVDYAVEQGFPNNEQQVNSSGDALKSCLQVGSPLDECNTYDHPRWNPHDTYNGFDAFGFFALPAGTRLSNGDYYSIGEFGLWWSSSENSTPYAWVRYITSGCGSVRRNYDFKTNGFSVRCFRQVNN